MADSQDSVALVAARHMRRTAGEVRFIKDRGGDHAEWAWNPPGASERTIDPEYQFDARNLESIARVLRSALMALGHIQTARSTFTRIKSQRISPDGNLGGKGYVMPIKDIRKQLSNCDEALSSISDTLYDEMQAPHWYPEIAGRGHDPRQRPELRNIMDDVDEIRGDPEDWAEGEEAEEDQDSGGDGQMGKTAGWRDHYDEDSPRPNRRKMRLLDERDRARCDDATVRNNLRDFDRSGVELIKHLMQEMQRHGWKVRSDLDGYQERETFGYSSTFSINVEGWSLPDDEVFIVCEGDSEMTETEVGVQYDVDDIDSSLVDVPCPPTAVDRFYILDNANTWRNSPKYPTNHQGVTKATEFLAGFVARAGRTAADRVASRYLARRKG